VSAQPGPWLLPGINDRLLALYAEGHTMRDITEKLNAEFGLALTRNSIIGRTHRIKLPAREAPVREKVKRVYVYKPRPRRLTRVDAPIAPDMPLAPRGEGTALTIYQLRSGDCKWPLGDIQDRPPFLFCGRDAGDASYCPEHHAEGHLTPRKVWI